MVKWWNQCSLDFNNYILECNIESSNFFSNPKFSKSIILMLVLRMHNSRFSFNEKLEPKHCCAAAHACILIKHENFLLNCNLNQIRLYISFKLRGTCLCWKNSFVACHNFSLVILFIAVEIYRTTKLHQKSSNYDICSLASSECKWTF